MKLKHILGGVFVSVILQNSTLYCMEKSERGCAHKCKNPIKLYSMQRECIEIPYEIAKKNPFLAESIHSGILRITIDSLETKILMHMAQMLKFKANAHDDKLSSLAAIKSYLSKISETDPADILDIIDTAHAWDDEDIKEQGMQQLIDNSDQEVMALCLKNLPMHYRSLFFKMHLPEEHMGSIVSWLIARYLENPRSVKNQVLDFFSRNALSLATHCDDLIFLPSFDRLFNCFKEDCMQCEHKQHLHPAIMHKFNCAPHRALGVFQPDNNHLLAWDSNGTLHFLDFSNNRRTRYETLLQWPSVIDLNDDCFLVHNSTGIILFDALQCTCIPLEIPADITVTSLTKLGERIFAGVFSDGTLWSWVISRTQQGLQLDHAAISMPSEFAGNPVLLVPIDHHHVILYSRHSPRMYYYDLLSDEFIGLKGHSRPINHVMSYKKNCVASCADDGKICLWDLATHQCEDIPVIKDDNDEPIVHRRIIPVAQPGFMLSCDADSAYYLWHLDSQMYKPMNGLDDQKIHSVVEMDGMNLAVCGYDGSVVVVNYACNKNQVLREGAIIRNLVHAQRLEQGYLALRFSDGTIELWDIVNKTHDEVPASDQGVMALKELSNNDLAICCPEGTITVWRVPFTMSMEGFLRHV